MTTEAELKRLIDLSAGDPRYEADFLRALLPATLYVHLPLAKSGRKLHLVCFTRPDGLTVIPIFSDPAKAQVAAQGAVRVGSVRGWELFMSAPGATFMLDPNDTSTTLYPEEITALLSNGTATLAPTFVPDAPVEVSPALPEDGWVITLLVAAVESIDAVEAVHLVHAHMAGSLQPTGLLAVIAVPHAFAERAARAVALALKASDRKPRLAVDMTTYEPGDPPEWVSLAGLAPTWTRRSHAGH